MALLVLCAVSGVGVVSVKDVHKCFVFCQKAVKIASVLKAWSIDICDA